MTIELKVYCFDCEGPVTFYECEPGSGCLHCQQCDSIVEEPGQHHERIVEESTDVLPDGEKLVTTVAVLADGDNTTWARDAFMIELTATENNMVTGGDNKLARRLAVNGRPTYSAQSMFECIKQIKKTLGYKNASLTMVRDHLAEFGFLDK